MQVLSHRSLCSPKHRGKGSSYRLAPRALHLRISRCRVRGSWASRSVSSTPFRQQVGMVSMDLENSRGPDGWMLREGLRSGGSDLRVTVINLPTPHRTPSTCCVQSPVRHTRLGGFLSQALRIRIVLVAAHSEPGTCVVYLLVVDVLFCGPAGSVSTRGSP